MKTKILFAAAGLACGGVLQAATLSVETAVQTRPDPSAPVITVLKAGSDEPAPSDKGGPVPPGWTAIEVHGPFEGYVHNRDLTKQLDVVPGATVYLSPKEDGPALAVFEKGDKAEITGLRGRWTQIRLDKTLVGYVHSGPIEAAPIAVAPASPAPAPTVAQAPSTPPPSASAGAPMPPAGESNVALSRLYEGTLATTQSLLTPKRPYDWQLLDASGKRIAYVDLSKLLLTEQPSSYVGRTVVVLGSIKPVMQSNDLVIVAEGFRLK
ncbi:MAG TPA: SH3 domain-containing protein [Opitutaceae bacterium]|jgi:hypothetical protein